MGRVEEELEVMLDIFDGDLFCVMFGVDELGGGNEVVGVVEFGFVVDFCEKFESVGGEVDFFFLGVDREDLFDVG